MRPEIEREFSLGSWVVQSGAAFFVPIILLTILETWLNIQGETVLGQVLNLSFLGGVAAAMALVASRISISAPYEGRWIWILPVLVVSAAVIWDVSIGHASELPGFFWDPGPGHGEEAIGTLLTWPAWSCCWYSAVMQLHRIKISWRTDEHRSSRVEV